ncbi:MAG TPA: DUF1772 domain-containing protein [Casimicrobiaceae bacterium]
MTTNTVWVVSLLLATLAMMPGAAHVLELPNKIGLSGVEYLTVQRLYRGWSFTRLVVAAALVSTVVLLFMVREYPTAFALAWVAFLCLVGTQLVFWTFTQPVNRVTANWTFLPGDWFELRRRWEYSHAASAALNLVALVALIVSLFWTNELRTFDLDAARSDYPGAMYRGTPDGGAGDEGMTYGRAYEPDRDTPPERAAPRYM